jgi:hypothetical protein
MSATISVPSETSFGKEDFQPAPDLERLVSRYIGKPGSRFAFLNNVRFAVMWKKKGGAYRGQPILGKAQKLTGLAKLWGESDFTVWLAADHLENFGPEYIANVLYHELLHIGFDDDKEKAVLVAHDAEYFYAEVEDLGLWRAELEQAAEVFRQLPLNFEPAAD